MDQILTQEEIREFGWNPIFDPNNLHYFKHFIEELLDASSYKSAQRVTGILVDYPAFTIPTILSILSEKYKAPKKGDWRIILPGLIVIRSLIIKHKRVPEVPTLYLKILQNLLSSNIKTLRNEAINSVVVLAYILYQELTVSNSKYIQKDMKKFSTQINPDALKNATDLYRFINSYQWAGLCEGAVGYKWKSRGEDPDWNTHLALEVFRAYWDDFSF